MATGRSLLAALTLYCYTHLRLVLQHLLSSLEVKGNEENIVLFHPLAPCVTFQLVLLIVGNIFPYALHCNEENIVLLYPLAPCVTFQQVLLIVGNIFPYALSPFAWVTQRSMKRTLYCFTHLRLVLRFNNCCCSLLKHWLHLFKCSVTYCTTVSNEGH